MRVATMWYGAMVLACVAAVSPGPAGSAASAGPAELAVLDGNSLLRFRMGFKTPVVVNAAGEVRALSVKTATTGKDAKPMPDFQSPAPPADWARPDFDDSAWSRSRGPVEIPAWAAGAPLIANTGYLACVRGKFMVDDPAGVKGLHLSIDFVGGAAVYVNGKELKRAGLPDGPLKPDTLAERYADETFIDADGFLVPLAKKGAPDPLARRVRHLADLEVPPALLRKGLNVVAVEVHRAPVSEALLTAKRQPKVAAAIVAHLGLLRLELTAGPGSAVTPNTGQPKGIHVWTGGPYDMVFANDPGDLQGPQPLPITIIAARNGTFSGRVVVNSSDPIRRLQASVTDLAQASGGGRIPASAIRVRYAEPASADKGWAAGGSWGARFDLLLDAPPAEVAVARDRSGGAAAVAPVWITVTVGSDVPAGEYQGQLTVQAEGLAPVKTPIRLTVHDWKLPDPKDFSVRNNFFPSPETVALYYKVPFWSPKHVELLGREMELLTNIGCRFAMINMVKNYQCMGNTESMVKWIRQADGTYKYDYGAVDKYLDAVAAKWVKPYLIRVNIWGERGVQRPVSVLDPATGKLDDLLDPPRDQVEMSAAFWKPALAGLRERLEKRGWLDVTAFGYTSYCAAPAATVATTLKQVWPDAKGYNTSHGNFSYWATATDKSAIPVIANEGVWASGGLYNPDARPGTYPMPWKGTARKINLGFPREGVGNIELLRESYSRLSYFRMTPESCLQGSLDGIGNVGVDFWPLRNDQGNARAPAFYRQANQDQLGPGSCLLAILSPGPDGPTVNERYEMFREGVQVAEAMIFLQRAADSGRLLPEMVRRIRDVLDERARQYLRTRRGMWAPQSLWVLFEGAGAQERDGQLFALCAEVAKAPGAK